MKTLRQIGFRIMGGGIASVFLMAFMISAAPLSVQPMLLKQP